MGIVIAEPHIALRRRAVPSILLATFDDHFVDKRLAEAGDLDPGTRLHGSTVLLPDQPLPSPRGGAHADHGARIAWVRGIEPALRQGRLRDLDRNRVDSGSLRAVHAGRCG